MDNDSYAEYYRHILEMKAVILLSQIHRLVRSDDSSLYISTVQRAEISVYSVVYTESRPQVLHQLFSSEDRLDTRGRSKGRSRYSRLKFQNAWNVRNLIIVVVVIMYRRGVTPRPFQPPKQG